MRRIITKLSLMVILSFTVLSAYSIPDPNPDKITGPTTVCGGTTQYYQVVMSNCFIIINDIRITNGTLVNPPSFPVSFDSFTVRWNSNSSGATVSGKVEVLVSYYPGACPEPGVPPPPINGKWLTLNVGIESNVINVNKPSAISYSRNRDQYTFSTSSSNAEYYSWSVSGGTVSGARNGPTLIVNANNGSCSISVTAYGYIENSCKTHRSSGTSRTVTITKPGTASTIIGPEEVNNNDITTYETNSVGASTYEWVLDPSSTNYIKFNGPQTTRFGTVFTVNPGTERRELKVRGKNSCGYGAYSPTKIIWANKYGGYGTIAGSENSVDVYPNPNSGSEQLTIDLKSGAFSKLIIIDSKDGSIVSQHVLTDLRSINLSNVPKGTYILRFEGSGITPNEIRKLVVE